MMIATPEQTEPPARAYARLLLKLHGLLAQGKGDTDEADTIRDQMDEPGYALTAEEDNRLGGLSADLYAVAEGGAKPVAASPAEQIQWAKDLKQAHVAQNWDRVLELLRHPLHESPAGTIPFMQARCWERLGYLEIALLFMQEAACLNPDEYRVCVLHLLNQLGRISDAAVQALQILEQAASEPESVYFVVKVLLGTAPHVQGSQGRPFYERLLPTLKRALAKERLTPKTQRSIPDLEVMLVCALGTCQDFLGQHDAALATYNEALARNPAIAEVLVFRGIALFEENRSAALQDFAQAVQVGSRSIVPYLLLADAAVVKEDFSRCLWLCQPALELTNHPRIRARLYEWIGIAQAMLAHPKKAILESFDRALELEPDNERIRSNRALAEATADQSGAGRPKWAIENLADDNIRDQACPEIFTNRLDPLVWREKKAESVLSA